ncbi:MAG: hypothetical protein M3281_07105 [Chloroflexota bacterium]|nr:hypothetical protein [Chloroflexota bacterium]
MRVKLLSMRALLALLFLAALALAGAACSTGRMAEGANQPSIADTPATPTPKSPPLADTDNETNQSPSQAPIDQQPADTEALAPTARAEDLQPTPAPRTGEGETAAPTGKSQQPGSRPVSRDPAPGKTTIALKDPLNRPYRPNKPRLQVPSQPTTYTPHVVIKGYTTYIYAVSKGNRRLVTELPARHFPGMFEKYVRISPDGSTMTYAKATKPLTDYMELWLVNLDGTNNRKLLSVREELWSAEPVWSPDSRRIAYVRAQSPGKKPGLEIWVVNADGTGNHRLLSHPSFNTSLYYGTVRSPLRWTEYGDLQYVNYEKGQVWTVDGETGKLSYVDVRGLKAPDSGIPIIKTKYPIAIFSQNDPRWRYTRVQTCGDTMGNVGCAINAVSMSFTAYGIKTTPKQLSKDLENFACPIYWSWASKYFSDKKLELWGVWAFDWGVLDLSLGMGRPAMVMLADAFTYDQSLLLHWVLVVGGGGRSPDGYRIYDPWDGTTYKTLAYYTSKGYNLQKVFAYGPRTPKKAKHADKANKGGESGTHRKQPD